MESDFFDVRIFDWDEVECLTYENAQKIWSWLFSSL